MVKGLGLNIDEYTFGNDFVFFSPGILELSSCHRRF
jgi:hypothetical protein